MNEIVTEILTQIDKLVDQIMKDDRLDDEEAKTLIDLEQAIHDKLSVVLDKFDVVVGDERMD
jgi:molecular chaperone GrpE (heat shock protein)